MRTRFIKMSKYLWLKAVYTFGVNEGATNRLYGYWRAIGITEDTYKYVFFEGVLKNA